MRLKYFYWSILTLALVMSSMGATAQYRNGLYVKSVAEEIIRKANATDNRSRVIALRDYLRKHVSFQDAPMEDRPFLRASAAETLQSGKGYCGEVTRAFIRLADAVGIRAQRINLYGAINHVVAEVELRPGERVIVDSQDPPLLPDLEPLDQVILRPEYTDYSTLNLRRLRLSWLVSRIKLEIGPLTYWAESPHALEASMWLALALTLLSGKLLYICGRPLARKLLVRRGWVKSADNVVLKVSEANRGVTPIIDQAGD
jgi:hypothetical protein